MLEGWLNLQSKENLGGQDWQVHGWRELALCEEGHTFSCCFVCPWLWEQKAVPCSVPGLSFVLSPGSWRPRCPLRPQCAVQCTWFGNRQLWAAVSWLKWAWRGWNLGWIGTFHFPGRQSQEELRFGPYLLLLRTSLLPGLAFVHIALQLQNTDLSSGEENKQEIFTVLL